MALEGFENATNAFLEWCGRTGIHISPKAALVDLRPEGRGRGLGEFSLLLAYVQLGRSSLMHRCIAANCCLVAMGDFEQDEVIFSIPYDAVLSVENAVSTFRPENTRITSIILGNMPSWL